MAVRLILSGAGLLSLAAGYSHARPAAGGASSARRNRPGMWSGAAGQGEQDIYGFEDVDLPPLPSGARLVIEEMGAESHDDAGDGGDEDAMWRRIQRYVATQEEEENDNAADIGGEVWPAATAMCAWLANHTAEVQGSSVLELGAGTGACGLYAAALGATHVLLTDGGSAALRELCDRNVAANAALFAPGARVVTTPLRWGRESGVLAAAATGESERGGEGKDGDGDGSGGSNGGGSGGAFEWIIASDCTYGSESGCQHESLCQALSALLLVRCTDAGGGDDAGAGRLSGVVGGGDVAGSSSSGGGSRAPRAILAHEHRARDSGLPWLRETLCRWDEGDEHLESFAAAARRAGWIAAARRCAG